MTLFRRLCHYFLLISACTWKLSIAQSSALFNYYACASIDYSDFFIISCPNPAQYIFVRSALIGFSDKYNGQTRPASCPWTSKTSATCDAIGFSQCAWYNPCAISCNCTANTTVPVSICNGKNSCLFSQTFLMASSGTALCLLSANANFISVNYTCIFPPTSSSSTTTPTTTTTRITTAPTTTTARVASTSTSTSTSIVASISTSTATSTTTTSVSPLATNTTTAGVNGPSSSTTTVTTTSPQLSRANTPGPMNTTTTSVSSISTSSTATSTTTTTRLSPLTSTTTTAGVNGPSSSTTTVTTTSQLSTNSSPSGPALTSSTSGSPTSTSSAATSTTTTTRVSSLATNTTTAGVNGPSSSTTTVTTTSPQLSRASTPGPMNTTTTSTTSTSSTATSTTTTTTRVSPLVTNTTTAGVNGPSSSTATTSTSQLSTKSSSSAPGPLFTNTTSVSSTMSTSPSQSGSNTLSTSTTARQPSPVTGITSTQSAGLKLNYYACRSPDTVGQFSFSCPAGDVITVQSAILGYSGQYDGRSQPPGCPWTYATSGGNCAAIGFPSCQTSCQCNCTTSTDLPSKLCDGQQTCNFSQAIVINPNGTGLCLLSTDANFISVNYTCSQQPCIQWKTYYGQHSNNGVQFVNVRRLSDCQDACIAREQCVAIDYDNTDQPCWLHFSSVDLTDDNLYWDNPTTNQYVITRRCTGSTSASSTVTTLMPTTPAVTSFVTSTLKTEGTSPVGSTITSILTTNVAPSPAVGSSPIPPTTNYPKSRR